MSSTKAIILFVVLIIAGMVIYFFTKPENKEGTITTQTQSNTGLASFNFGNIVSSISSIWGANSPKVNTSDNSFVPRDNEGPRPRG